MLPLAAALLLSSVSSPAALPAAAAAAQTAFHPGQVWDDTDGNPIRAHSAGLLQPHTATPHKYYWYGADNYTSGDGTNVWINVCKSSSRHKQPPLLVMCRYFLRDCFD
jgi:hypothetical protein